MTRTPLRVSLFGGGTDYPEYYERRPGGVVGMTIDKYIYIALTPMAVKQAYDYRVSYSVLELADCLDNIKHPVVRETLKHFGVDERLDISIISDLPASGSGLGSSSAFTVGFINAVCNLQGQAITKIDLARKAIMVERELLIENVGVQDQLHSTFGGINRFDFQGRQIRITPLQIPADNLRALSGSMVLVHTGIARRATAIVSEQVEATRSKKLDYDLGELYALVDECVDLLEGGDPDMLARLGAMLSESWRIKRGLTDKVSNDEINELFETILSVGAYGAKLCGAGGGGYFLALVPPERRAALFEAVGSERCIPIALDHAGSTLVYPSSIKVGW